MDSKTKRIALPVKWIDASGQEESRESLLLPAQVTPKIFLKAAARLCHFASFVVK
ncbi:MAG: hypothetical protein Q8R07_05320 [Candidatus Uhrbacteria bacterium]|nr:hypothetical protein [Candidatus Uhrbacteria bacterium]